MPDLTSKSTLPRARVPWWFRLIRALLNLALLSLLGLQLFALFILSDTSHLRLPTFAQAALEERLQEEGLRVRFSSVEASPSGSLLVLDPKVYLTGTTEPVIEAEYLLVEPDWLTLLWSRRLSFSAVRFGNATFYCPPENSPSGTREPFITNLGLNLSNQGNSWWQLDYLRGKILNVQMQAEGNFVLPASWQPSPMPTNRGTPPPPATPALSLAARFRKFARDVLDLRHQFDIADRPSAQISVSGENSGVNKLKVFAQAAGVESTIPSFELAHPALQLTANWDEGVLRALGPAYAWAQSVQYTQTGNTGTKSAVVSLSSVWAQLQLADGKDGIFSGWPQQVAMYSLTARLNDFAFDSLEGVADLRSWPKLPFSATVLHGPDKLSFSGRTDLAEEDRSLVWHGGTFAFHAIASLDTLLVATHQKLPARLAAAKFDAPLQLEGDAVVTPSGTLQSAVVRFHADGAHFERINLDSASGRANFFRNEAGDMLVQVDNAEFDNRSWQVTGSYSQNLRVNDFTLHVSGDIEPGVLDSYFEDWWPEVWKIVIPGGEWPQADVVYAGNWDAPDWQDSIMVGAQITHARARGVRMDDIFVRVDQRPEILSVYDLIAHATDGGQLTGALLWTMNPPYEDTYEQRMIFESTMPLPDVALLGGPDAAQALRPLESKTRPTIRFDQRTGGSANPQPDVTVSKIHADFPSPLQAYHVPLENAVADITLSDGFTDIPNLEFGLAGGQAKAHATVTTLPDGKEELRFSVLEQNTKQADFLSAIGQFSTNELTPTTTSGVPANGSSEAKNSTTLLGDPSRSGLIDLTLGGQLILGEPDSFTATGSMRMHDAQLGKLQLLGGLSRVLADTKVPLGDFVLNAATSNLQIARRYLRLPNLIVTGPTARIVAAGTYHFTDQDLDFNALIFPVGQWDSGVLKDIASIINPFSNTVTLKLHGKIDKPVWDLSMNPLRLFKDQTVEGPAIPGVPAKTDNSPDFPMLPPAPPLPELLVPEKK